MIELTEAQRAILTTHNYIEREHKPGLWAQRTRKGTKYIDLRTEPARTYQFPTDGGPSTPGDTKLLRTIMGMTKGQERLF